MASIKVWLNPDTPNKRSGNVGQQCQAETKSPQVGTELYPTGSENSCYVLASSREANPSKLEMTSSCSADTIIFSRGRHSCQLGVEFSVPSSAVTAWCIAVMDIGCSIAVQICLVATLSQKGLRTVTRRQRRHISTKYPQGHASLFKRDATNEYHVCSTASEVQEKCSNHRRGKSGVLNRQLHESLCM